MSLSENLHNLGTLLKTNLETKGINGLTGNEGLTTLANKILDIEGSSSSSKSVVAHITGNNVTIGKRNSTWLIANDATINWGDGTSNTVDNPQETLSHTYTDGVNEHLIALDGTITGLGIDCFYGCTGLTSIFIPNSITSIGARCFIDCSGLTSVVIPNSVTSLGDQCFFECSGLTSVTIPSSVTSLGDECFKDCSGLTSIVIPDSVTSLGNWGFYNCSGLTSIIIPDSVTSLGNACFGECSGLTSIVIPDSVTSLGGYCFYGCSGLIDYELYWETQPIPYDSQKMPVNNGTVFTIPHGTTSIYTDAGYPSNNLVERGESLTLTCDKPIIQKTETSTVTATLKQSGSPLTGKTLNYQVKHGNTVISSGTKTTNNQGQATITYTGTGVGNVSVEVTYGTLLQETYSVDDTYNYDDATLSNAHEIWVKGIECLERHDTYSSVIDVDGVDGLINTPIPSNCLIELDLMVDKTVWAWCVEIGVTGWSLADNYTSAQTNTWYHVKLEVGTSSSTMYVYNTSTGVLLGSKTKTHSSTASRLFLRSRDANTVTSFKNVRIYNV